LSRDKKGRRREDARDQGGRGGHPRERGEQTRESPRRHSREHPHGRRRHEQSGPSERREHPGPEPRERQEFEPADRQKFKTRQRREHDPRERREHDPRERREHDPRERREYDPRERTGVPAGVRVAQAYAEAAGGRTRRSPRDDFGRHEGSAAPEPAHGEGTQVFGVQPVLEALRAGTRPIERVSVADGVQGARLQDIMRLARAADVPVRRVPRAELQRLAGMVNHQGVVATIAAARYHGDEELLASLAARVGTDDPPLAVVLDGVEDPRNLGAIIRTIECAGAHAVFVPERRAAGLTEAAAKSAAGALEYVPVARTTNVARLLDELKSRGVWTVGTSAEAGSDYTEWDWTQPCALLLGGEGEGLRRLVRERCDALVRIPLRGHIESLNVSVAAGVVLYEALRQRTVARERAYKAAERSGDGET
jgi:23S rRNA (guanosine2251-2'-O)-methyltransferase